MIVIVESTYHELWDVPDDVYYQFGDKPILDYIKETEIEPIHGFGDNVKSRKVLSTMIATLWNLKRSY